MSTIQFVLDGKTITASPGQTILKAAEAAGVYIPRLCAYKDLVPHGSCRVCSVRVNGRIQAACVQTATNGAVVESDTEELREFRRNVVDMLFVEGNHYCMFCAMTGVCELQSRAYELGITHTRYDYIFPVLTPDTSGEYFVQDHNRCILCGRCVRVSQDLDQKNVFQFVNRGHNKRLQVNGAALAATDLRVTDAVVASCPVGALMRKRVGYAVPVGSRPFDAQPIGAEVEAGEGGIA